VLREGAFWLVVVEFGDVGDVERVAWVMTKILKLP
jgi:hypothetical protein